MKKDAVRRMTMLLVLSIGVPLFVSACMVAGFDILEVSHVKGKIVESSGDALEGAKIEIWTTGFPNGEDYQRHNSPANGFFDWGKKRFHGLIVYVSAPPRLIGEYKTDTNGVFDLGNIPPGNYEIIFSSEGLGSERTFLRVIPASAVEEDENSPEIEVYLSDGRGSCPGIRQVPDRTGD